MSESESDTSRTVVQTYVPAYQRDEWDEHADQLGMNRSEFIRTMVQAGRTLFGAESMPDLADHDDLEAPELGSRSTGVSESADDGESLETQIVGILGQHDHLTWDELFEELTDDIESRLEDTLQDLQDANRVRYSGRDGGYVLTEDEQ